MKNDRLYDFLSGKRTNSHGIDIYQIWSFNDKQLESQHNYIQWIFPLKEASLYNPLAPVIKDINVYNCPEVKNNMLVSFVIMCKFYGFDANNDKNGIDEIKRANNFAEKASNWITPDNHNYLRITRILKSLMMFELKNEAKLFFAALEEVYAEYSEIIGEKTFFYWKNAINS